MDWENELYVKLYIRDTLTWKKIGWEGRALLTSLMRVCDRAGVLDGIYSPIQDLCMITEIPEEHARAGYGRLIQMNVLKYSNNSILLVNFFEAQNTPQSQQSRDKLRRIREKLYSKYVDNPRDATRCHTNPRDATNRIEENRIEENKIEENRIEENKKEKKEKSTSPLNQNQKDILESFKSCTCYKKGAGAQTVYDAVTNPVELATILGSGTYSQITNPARQVALAADWTMVNKQKAKKNIASFIRNWFNRQLKDADKAEASKNKYLKPIKYNEEYRPE